MKPHRRVALVLAALLCTAAQAQLRVPSVTVPALPPGLPPVQQLAPPLPPLQDLRASIARDLLRRHPQLIEADPAGQPIRRSELVWISPTAGAVEAARAQGFAVLREEALPELDLRELLMRAPAGVGTVQAAERLRALDPGAQVDFNHLYTPGGNLAPAANGVPRPAGEAARRVGLVDGGIDARHPAFRAATVRRWGCEGREVASDHGTAVASLLVGRDGRAFAAAAAGATLHAADVYCGDPAGGAADDVARALAWMARERVAVVNVSLVGPANRLLEHAVAALLRRGHVIVAAVGNDGPAAPPLYPASYPGVVGVSGVTPARRALPEAAQGPQVMFAAPGTEIAAARAGGGYADARGTSFAAPFVAALLAHALPEPDPQAAAAALERLATGALDLGAPGRDPVFGIGLVGESLRVAPARLR